MTNHSGTKECGREQDLGQGKVVTGCLSSSRPAKSPKSRRGTKTYRPFKRTYWNTPGVMEDEFSLNRVVPACLPSQLIE